MSDELDEAGLSWAWDVARSIPRGLAMLVKAGESDKDTGTTLFVASTDSPDRAMDVVKQDWRLRDFRANPVILDNHDHRAVVGKAVDVTVPKNGDDAGKLMIRVKWDLDNPDPAVKGVGHQHLSGFRSAGSVGFRAGKKTERSKLDKDHPAYQEPIEIETWWGGKIKVSGFYYERNELFEFSSATVPMNPEALQRSYLGEPPELQPASAEIVALSLLDQVRAASAEERRAIVELLHVDLLAIQRSSPEFRRLVAALAEFGPPTAKSRPTPRGDNLDWLYPPRLEI